MCRFIETIRICNSQICSIDYHNRRFNNTRKISFNEAETVDLEMFIKPELNNFYSKIKKDFSNTDKGLFPEKTQPENSIMDMADKTLKCRIVYSDKIESIEITSYVAKKIKSLKTVICDNINYSLKYLDRSYIGSLLSKRENCDDILIIKNSFITDISYANVVFSDGEKYYTPEEPLLNGTMRQRLIDQNRITPARISVNDLKHFKYITPINAMLDLNTLIISVENIF